MNQAPRPPREPADPLGRILLAYVEKRASADATAKALLDELKRSRRSINIQMDADLRAAVARLKRAHEPE